MTNITITTSLCEGCSNDVKEGGLQLLLRGDYGVECLTNGLDNLELRDFTFGNTAVFDGMPGLDGDDDGLGHCKDVRKIRSKLRLSCAKPNFRATTQII